MGMTRTVSLAYIAEQNLSRTEALSGVVPGDNAAGYKSALDEAALAGGISYDNLADYEVMANIRGYRAAVRYYALNTNANGLLSKLSTSEIGARIRQEASHELEQVRKAMDDASREALTYGVIVGPIGASGVMVDTIDFDIYEPYDRIPYAGTDLGVGMGS